MVKFVADIRRAVMAVGGELHADAEAMLLESGAAQEDLWGGNYYPGRGTDHCVEYSALINIRPAQANPGMEIADPGIRRRVRELALQLIGRGEAL
jgi:hypothetical protein